MSAMLEAALRYAALGWHIFPLHSIRFDKACGCGKPECASPGKHPRIKWKEGASCDPVEVEKLWRKWPNAGIGLATGPSGLIVFDLDGPKGVMTFKELCNSGGIVTPITARARTARGMHVFFRGQSPTFSNTETKLDVRSVGGYVVLAPSPHVSGHVYRWEVEPDPSRIADCPAPLLAYASDSSTRAQKRRAAGGQGVGGMSGAPQGGGPALSPIAEDSFTTRLGASLDSPDWGEVDRALACIPADCSMDKWIKVGMALHAARDPSGWERWNRWSATSKEKYPGQNQIAYKWNGFKHGGGVGIGSLFGFAKEFGWKREEVMPTDVRRNESPETRPPPEENEAGAAPFEGMNGHANADPSANAQDMFGDSSEDKERNPLILLNRKHAVIADVGSRCVVFSWVNSALDPKIKVPSLQSFKSFSERYANQYVEVTKTVRGKEVEEAVQLGSHWLKWTKRRTYQGLELNPGGPEVSDDGLFNIWRGFGCEARAGEWHLMQHHIRDVLAGGDEACAFYIVRWAAWAVQNPGRRAEVALVLRGGKGAGKGVFANTMADIFGAHGLQIFNPKHLVGNFNAHMRSCLLLFADEAFWAGDKAGESTLKGLVTEPKLFIEQKGLDAVAWPNKLHIIMAANADWVVPASKDERRYAVFNVSDAHASDHKYFQALHAEINSGGREAMLYDLLRVDLTGWHPRDIPQTEALREQKMHSMPPLWDWWESVLQNGYIPKCVAGSNQVAASDLLYEIRIMFPRSNLNPSGLGRFLRDRKCTNYHKDFGNVWEFPDLTDARKEFEHNWGAWMWEEACEEWKTRLKPSGLQ